MAVLWLALLWCHHVQQILHASPIFQSTSWTNITMEEAPTPTQPPPSTSLDPLPTPSIPSSIPSLTTSPPYLPPSSPHVPISSPLPFTPSPSTPTTASSSLPPSPGPDQPDEEGRRAALGFLHSGNLLFLSEANCTKRHELTDLRGRPTDTILDHTRGPRDSLLHATNFLNMIFQASDMRESSIREDIEWYHALVRSLAGGDPHIHRAMLSLTTHPMSSKPQLLLQATKEGHEILLRDLSSPHHHRKHRTDWGSWGNFQASPSLTKEILLNDLQSLDTPKWSRGDSYIVDPSHVHWSKPFLECEGGHFVPGWMVSLSTAFFGLKPDLSPEFKGALRVDVRLQSLGIDQCSQGPGWFANTHSCDENSTQCVSDERNGSILGRYRCVCQPGYYRTQHEGSGSAYPGVTACGRCSEGCATCVDGSPCLVEEDWALRVTVLSLQAAGMLGVFLSMLVAYNFRESKRIRASGLLLLETILFGSLLLYFPVFILYFKPSVFRCAALRWVRLLGFCIVYGTIVLKLYRVMKVFISRTAQRIPYMTSMRLLRMLSVMVLLCTWFLVGWTLGVLENLQRGVPMVIRSQTREGLVFYTCDHDRWDYMMSLGEFLLLSWGTFLCYEARSVPSAFHEPRYMGLAVHNEMFVSAAFHVLRFVMVTSLHPDWTLLLFFIHTHGTVTMTLILLLVPKFLHAGGPPREEIAAEVYEDELDLRRSRSNLNSSITSAWSEHSLDPDDIRDELKKLYAQLEVHKTKKMIHNNPHLQKKRSSRRGLGRSIMRRITEIPDSVTRQCGREEKEGSPNSGGGQKRRQQDSGSVKLREESLRQRVLSLRKSHSTYDHMQESKDSGSVSPRLESSARDASLRDSLMRRNLARNVSLRSHGDSLRQAPLVCKSLSAHNLLADKKPLSVSTGALQKSHSMIGSAHGKGPLTGASETSTERATEGSRNPLLGGSFDKAEVCPWELQELPTYSESKAQKHVTYAPGKCSSMDTSHVSGKPHISQGKKEDTGAKHQSLGSRENLRSDGVEGNNCYHLQDSTQQKTGDPSSITVKPGAALVPPSNAEGEGFKALNAEVIGTGGKSPGESAKLIHKSTLKTLVLAVRAFKGTAAGRQHKERARQAAEGAGVLKKQQVEELKTQDAESDCIRDGELKSQLHEPAESESQACLSPQRECFLKMNKDKDEMSSSPKMSKQTPPASKFERMSQLREAVCPWESMEGPHDAPQKSNSVESRRSEICPWESTDSEGPGGPMSQSGSNFSFHIPPPPVEGEKRGLHKEICPWEGEEEERQREEICPWEGKDAGDLRAKICPWETGEMEKVAMGGLNEQSLVMKLEELGRQRDAVCPWESEESGGSPGLLSQSQSKTFDGGPIQSKTSDSLDLEARRGEICPWESLDSEGTPAILSQSQSHSWDPATKALVDSGPLESPKTSKPPLGQLYKSQSKQDSMCSWSSEEPRPLSKIMSKSEGRMGDLYPPIKPAQHGKRWHHSLRLQSKVHAENQESSITPQEGTELQAMPPTRDENSCSLAEICPWEVQEKPLASTESVSHKADVCPWDFQ
ncbi:probable G-protein coupled receptor 179 [Spea bombifrons]|uniref:probable G-protein coupled receptor 179 n=1 Tax=Spea bombifrons TaxID=233779 RepID=UPI00234B7865|nr:probable G-protein coupled receptor 179 [Spea bombifrons]